jgi:hypothetical protein
MHAISPDELVDPLVLSKILDRALFRLSNSRLRIAAAQVAKALSLHESDLARLRSLWRKPETASRLHLPHLYIVVRYLFRRHPTLKAWQRSDGSIDVRLLRRNGKRTITSGGLPDLPVLRQKTPRPGTTKWFMLHAE